MYRGWYNGKREFGSAVATWEFCLAEWNAQFLGDSAYQISEQENIALIGHGGSGKTSLTAALMFAAGGQYRLGRVDDGTAVTDFDEEELERKISLQTAATFLEWQDKKVNLIDTPGYAAFIADAKVAMAAAGVTVRPPGA